MINIYHTPYFPIWGFTVQQPC